MKPIILENVTKVYRDFWGRTKAEAVHDLSFGVEPGEVFGLLGPNGSGKTTTLKLMLGLVFPTRGKLWMFEKEPANVAVKRRIGFLPEESYLYSFLTAAESLRFYARFFDLPDRPGRIRELLDLVGLAYAQNRPVREYSKGMARRLGLAQALVNEPDLLLLDEPTSGLDPIGSHEVKDLIRNLKARGTTIILCSHLLADVEDVCDRIAILHKGRLQVMGRVDDLLVRRERLQITCTGLDAAGRERVTAGVAASGGTVVEVREERTRLEDLFVRTIRDGNADAGRSA
ncbi:MAG: ABC transporter ATP-binding protein [Planctomycetota bacterium]